MIESSPSGGTPLPGEVCGGWSAAHATGTGTLSGLMPVTVEPGVYLEGRGGVRIEDTLVVRADGPPDLLTMTPKDLTVLPAH